MRNLTKLPITYQQFEDMADRIFAVQERWFVYERTNNYVQDYLFWVDGKIEVYKILSEFGMTIEQYDIELETRLGLKKGA